MKLEFSRQIFEKYSNIKFYGNPSIGSRIVPCVRTDMMELKAAFRNFTNKLKMKNKKKVDRCSVERLSLQQITNEQILPSVNTTLQS